MAGIFTPEQAEQIQRAAETTVSVFKDRFDKKQYEDFKQNEYAEYIASQQQLMQKVLQSEDPERDDLSQAFASYQQNQNRLFDWAAKYKDNPYISDLANRHMEHDKTMFDEMMTMEEKAHAMGRRDLIEKREGRLQEAQIGAAEALGAERAATTAQIKELTPLKAESERALAEQRRAKATQPGTGKEQYFGYITDMLDPESLQEMAGNPQSLPAIRQLVEANISRRSGPTGEALKEEYNDIVRKMAKNYIDRAKARGEQRESGMDWDYSEESIRAATALVDRDSAKTEHIRRRMVLEGQRLGFSPQEVAEEMSDLYQTILPLTGAINYGEMTATLFGKDPRELAVNLGIDKVEDVLKPNKLADKIMKAKNLKLDNIALANTPIAQGFSAVLATGGFNPNNPDQKFESYSELVKFLTSTGEEHVIANIGGADASDKDLPKSSQEARQAARKLYGAVIAKFAPELARELNLKGAPPGKKSDWELLEKSGSAYGLLRKATRKVFGGEE